MGSHPAKCQFHPGVEFKDLPAGTWKRDAPKQAKINFLTEDCLTLECCNKCIEEQMRLHPETTNFKWSYLATGWRRIDLP